jgi:hypothetical protein
MIRALWSRWKRTIRGVGIAAVAVIGLVAGTHFYLRWSAQWELQRAVAEADRLDPGWRLEELESKRSTLADDQNSALKVLDVKARMPARWPNRQRTPAGPGRMILETDLEINVDDELGQFPPEMQASPDFIRILNRIRNYSNRNLDKARSLSQFSRGRYPIEYAMNRREDPPASSQALVVAQLLWADAVLAAQEQKMDQALASCLAILNTGRSIGDEPLGESQLRRLSMGRLAARTMERVLAQGQSTANPLREAQRLVEDEASEPLLLRVCRAERADAYRSIVAIQSGKLRYRLQFFHGRIANRLPNSWNHYVNMAIVQRAQPEYFRLLTASVEIAKLPPEEWSSQMKWLNEKADDLPIEFRSWFQTGVGAVEPYQIHQALLRCTLAALAVESYRLAHGKWPESLASMGPELLRETPIDPFDGRPLRFRRLENGLVIYSVGPDGQDDGGILNRLNFMAKGTDLGFQLWDVSERWQPWRPTPESDDED